MFQRQGAKAFNKDLTRTIQLISGLGNPQDRFKSIHIAGTNGKGTSAHMICSALMESGYDVGLYTSPHLKSFTERIKINGSEVDKNFVLDFVNTHYDLIRAIEPSFFEITVAMAFEYFAQREVDFAVIEVGMGGRLDSTNIITPLVSLITQIGLDHQQFLGETIEEIAKEKAGIIKTSVPVVIGDQNEALKDIFREVAGDNKSDIRFADSWNIIPRRKGLELYRGDSIFFNELNPELKGNYISKNLPGVLEILTLMSLSYKMITKDSIKRGIENTITNTGLKGRWQQLREHPSVICDTGHNIDGVKVVMSQLNDYTYKTLRIIWGSVSDKDLKPVLDLLPRTAIYYFCKPDIPRGMDQNQLQKMAEEYNLYGEAFDNVNEALKIAVESSDPEDLIFIGGSTFVVAELEDL